MPGFQFGENNKVSLLCEVKEKGANILNHRYTDREIKIETEIAYIEIGITDIETAERQ